MATILAIDTTSEHGSVALERDARLLECREIHAQQSFSRVIFDEVTALLARHNVRLPDIDVYAAASGPGSFTGVRVGLAAAKGLAAAHGRLVAPVSNLEATALMAGGGARILIPLLDARRGELYACAYERAESPEGVVLRPLMEEVVRRPAALEERLHGLNLPPAETVLCGPDVERLAITGFERRVTGRALAPAVAELARQAHRAGRALAPEIAEANYVRRSDAEIFNKPVPATGEPGEK